MLMLNSLARLIDLVLLQPISQIIETCLNVIYYFLWGSYCVGYCLVEGGAYLWHFLCDVYVMASLIAAELIRFYDELCQIVQEVGCYLQGGATDGVSLLRNSGRATAQHLYSFGSTTQLHTRLWAAAVGGTLSSLASFLCRLLIGLGNFTLWLLLLIPRFLIAILDEIIRTLDAIVRFVLARGLELLSSAFRLSIGLAVLLVIYMFRGYLYLVLVYSLRQLRIKLKNQLRGFCLWLELRKSQLLLRRSQETTSSIGPGCVVCLDHNRSIVVLPCRHLCLCKDCSDQLLVQGQDRCPVCRRFIETLLPVYV